MTNPNLLTKKTWTNAFKKNLKRSINDQTLILKIENENPIILTILKREALSLSASSKGLFIKMENGRASKGALTLSRTLRQNEYGLSKAVVADLFKPGPWFEGDSPQKNQIKVYLFADFTAIFSFTDEGSGGDGTKVKIPRGNE